MKHSRDDEQDVVLEEIHNVYFRMFYLKGIIFIFVSLFVFGMSFRVNLVQGIQMWAKPKF